VTTTKPHEALAVPLEERIHYLTVVASMAGVDVVLTPEELGRLEQLCRELELPDTETKRILTIAHRPTASIERHLDALRASPLRFALLTDCLSMAYADGEYAKGEQREIRDLARALEVDDTQLAALEECVKELRLAPGAPPPHHEKLSERLAAVGIPVGLVATLSAVGLTSAGVSSGAAAVAMGLGIASGFGAVVGLGVGTVVGVRWLHAKLKHGATS
jgi:uncharacterized tellurite resistance protein B-like protein